MSKPSLPEKKRISAREFLVATRGPYRRLFSFIKPYRGRFIIGLVCGALFGALNGLLIYTLGYVADEVLPKEQLQRKLHEAVQLARARLTEKAGASPEARAKKLR